MDLPALVQECAPQVAPVTILAVIKAESSGNPWAININGRAVLERQARNYEEAAVTARWLIEQGYNIDVGLGQVNSANFARFGLTPERALIPCVNVGAAGRILEENYRAARAKGLEEQTALHAAFSAYNTGNFRYGYKNGYVQRVIAQAGRSSK